MKTPEIIATIGMTHAYSDIRWFDYLVDQGICYFRFNVSKVDRQLERHLEWVQSIYDRNPKCIKIMLDIPVPGKKPRISLKRHQEMVAKHELWQMTADVQRYKTDNQRICYVDVPNLGDRLALHERILYGDGEGVFQVVQKVNASTVLVKAQNSFIMYPKKALAVAYMDNWMYLEEQYGKILQAVSAYSIAGSFVTRPEEAVRLGQYFPQQQVISKIETDEGIACVHDIARVSDIMLGRGDLSLYTDYHRLYQHQNVVKEACKQHACKFYFATGLLTSLMQRSVPSQADIIDMTNALVLKPDYIVLNYGLVRTNIEGAIYTIQNICKYL